VDVFRQATEDGLEVGSNGARDGAETAPGRPAQVAQELQHLVEEVFDKGFAEAMHPTLVLPSVVVVLAAISGLAVRQGKVTTWPQSTEQVEDAA